MRLSHATVALLSVLLLAGCQSSGSDSKPTSTKTNSTPGSHGPSCKDVWQDGATLPKGYTTCDDDGALGAQDVTKCEDGTKLIAYSDVYFAVTGGTISKPKEAPMQDTPEFGKAFASCTGE